MSHATIDTPVPTSSPGSPPQVKTNEPRVGWLRSLVAAMSSSLLTIVTLVAFAGVFYYGHHNDWKIPKFAELTGSAEPVVSDWCEEHAVPESICVECDPTLMPRGPDYGWCPQHGVHNCTLDHPDVAQLKETPTVLASDLERATRALSTGERKENNSACKIYNTRIQFASVESVQQAGVDVELVERQPIIETIRGSGEIVYDPTRLASLASRVPGSVWMVQKNVGDQVERGEVLALVDAAEVGELKTDLLRALAEERLQKQNVSRLSQAKGSVAGARILDAQAALAKAQADVLSAEQSLHNLGLPVDVNLLRGLSDTVILEQLRLLGIPESLRQGLSDQTSTANLLPILSPMTGLIVDRSVTPGEVVDSTRTLFQVANLSQMWLLLNLPLEHRGQLAVGQSVRFQPDGSTDVVEGKLDWISTTADQQTRMFQVRAVLPNSDGLLLNETFGTGDIILREEPEAIVIPNGSSHWEGCCQVVFVRDKNYFTSSDSPKVFHVRSVRLGASNDKYTEVISGVLPGEVIAVAGSDVLRAQLLKNNLGAGCDCVAE